MHRCAIVMLLLAIAITNWFIIQLIKQLQNAMVYVWKAVYLLRVLIAAIRYNYVVGIRR